MLNIYLFFFILMFFLPTHVNSKVINKVSENVTCFKVNETRSVKKENFIATINIPITDVDSLYDFSSRLKFFSKISKIEFECLRPPNAAGVKKGRFGGGGRLKPAKWKKIKVTTSKLSDSKLELQVNFQVYIPPRLGYDFNEVFIDLHFNQETETLEVIENDLYKGLYIVHGDYNY